VQLPACQLLSSRPSHKIRSIRSTSAVPHPPAQVLDHEILIHKGTARHLAQPQPPAVPAGRGAGRAGQRGRAEALCTVSCLLHKYNAAVGSPFVVPRCMQSHLHEGICCAHLTGPSSGELEMPNSESCLSLQQHVWCMVQHKSSGCSPTARVSGCRPHRPRRLEGSCSHCVAECRRPASHPTPPELAAQGGQHCEAHAADGVTSTQNGRAGRHCSSCGHNGNEGAIGGRCPGQEQDAGQAGTHMRTCGWPGCTAASQHELT
jgi:hypothetical protein